MFAGQQGQLVQTRTSGRVFLLEWLCQRSQTILFTGDGDCMRVSRSQLHTLSVPPVLISEGESSACAGGKISVPLKSGISCCSSAVLIIIFITYLNACEAASKWINGFRLAGAVTWMLRRVVVRALLYASL